MLVQSGHWNTTTVNWVGANKLSRSTKSVSTSKINRKIKYNNVFQYTDTKCWRFGGPASIWGANHNKNHIFWD